MGNGRDKNDIIIRDLMFYYYALIHITVII